MVDELGAGRTKLRDCKEVHVPVLRRAEFASETAQNVFQSAQKGAKVDYESYSSIALFAESPTISFETSKLLLMLRRDLFMKLTKSSMFVFDVCQARALYRSGCTNGSCGLLGALVCEDNLCRLMGGCYEHFSSITCHALNK